MGRPLGLAKTGGRAAGVQNKRTVELIEKMAAKGASPEEFLADVMLDDIGAEAHPLVTLILDIGAKKLPTKAQWLYISDLADKAQDELLQKVPLEDRIVAAAKLMPHLYPKIRSVEYTGDIAHTFPQLGLTLRNEKMPAPKDEKVIEGESSENA